MGNLEEDTRVERNGDSYRASLSKDWHIWGPCGGYMAAVAMRAVGVHTDLRRPASFTCHFLGVGAYEPVDIEVRTLRRSKRAESVGVSIRQEGRPLLEAVAWVVGEVEGLVHESATMPGVPRPDELKSFEELVGEEDESQSKGGYTFWNNFDERPLQWLSQKEWESRPASDPIFRHWVRFRPDVAGDDPFVEAARLLVPLDVCMWPSATRGHAAGSLRHIAPSLDLSAVFHRLDDKSRWLLMDGFAPVAGDGIVGAEGRVWSEDGQLLCTGVQSMLCRPAPESS